MDITDVEREGMNWIQVVQDRVQWKVPVNTVKPRFFDHSLLIKEESALWS
jgi:hypothetical protein